MQTNYGQSLAANLDKNAMQQIADWAKTSAELLRDSAKRETILVLAKDYLADADEFSQLAHYCRAVIGESPAK